MKRETAVPIANRATRPIQSHRPLRRAEVESSDFVERGSWLGDIGQKGYRLGRGFSRPSLSCLAARVCRQCRHAPATADGLRAARSAVSVEATILRRMPTRPIPLPVDSGVNSRVDSGVNSGLRPGVRLRADPWAPDHGMGFEAVTDEIAPRVDAAVETSDWSRPRVPGAVEGCPLHFVDG